MGYPPEEELTASHKGSEMVVLRSTIGKAASLAIGNVGDGPVPYVPTSSRSGTVP